MECKGIHATGVILRPLVLTLADGSYLHLPATDVGSVRVFWGVLTFNVACF